MSAVFLTILNLAINASWLILAVIVARFFLRKAPKWTSCLLWGLVAVRLLCPVSLESALSLLPSGRVVPDDIEMAQEPHIDSGVRIIDNAVNPVIKRSFSPDVSNSANPMQIVVLAASVIWLIGMAAMLMYALISFVLLKKKVRASVAISGKVKECDEVGSPFIFGIFRPVIYVPSGMNERTFDLVIAHEEAHLKRHDHWWKPFGFLLLSVYWFNPLCWVAYILLCRDIEAACDEKVIQDKDRDYMAAYSQALLDCSVHRRIIAACPVAFGETGVKERVKGVLNYKKPTFWVIVVAIIACIVVAVCFMTNPKDDPQDESGDYEAAPYMLHPYSESGLDEKISEKVVPRPIVDLSAYEGSDLTELMYADKDKIIFSGYFGLFVYSKEKRIITNAIDLEPIGCNYTQGDNYCEKFVSADGNEVYLHPVSSTEMYVYDITSDILSQEKYDLEGCDLHELHHNEEGEIFDVWSSEDRSMETYLYHGNFIGELGYIEYGPTSADKVIPYNPFFSPNGLSGAIDFAPKDIHDVVSADIWIAGTVLPPDLGLSSGQGYLLHCDDPGKISELEKLLSEAEPEKGQSGCPFYTALYLTRSDGMIGTVFPATDNCAMYLSGRECYKYSNETNEALWSLIGEFELVNVQESEEHDNPIGVTMSAVDITPTGCKLVFSQNGGNVTGELQTGQWYELQVKNANGEWIDNSSKDIERCWEDIAYLIKNNGTTEMTLDWEDIYGYLRDGHYRIAKKVMDYRNPGDYDEYEVYAEFDLGEKEKSTEDISNWMDIDLPTGYDISDIYDDIGWMGGALILPKSYWEASSETAPIEWQYSGVISRIPAANVNITFTNGLPNHSGIPIDNHTVEEYIGVIGLERSTNQWPAIMLKESHDLYTQSEIEDMKQKGIDTDNMMLTADYWNFWFVKEGEATYYILTLSAKEFSQDEAERIARTVSIN